MKLRWSRAAALGVLLLVPSAARAGDSLWGTVTAVKAADLVELDYGGGTYEVRIVGVEVPKDDGPVAREAKRFVVGLLQGKHARIRTAGRAESGGLIARVFTDDPELGIKEVGVELLRNGLAWRVADYDEKYGELAAAESEARAAGRGVWAAAAK